MPVLWRISLALGSPASPPSLSSSQSSSSSAGDISWIFCQGETCLLPQSSFTVVVDAVTRGPRTASLSLLATTSPYPSTYYSSSSLLPIHTLLSLPSPFHACPNFCLPPVSLAILVYSFVPPLSLSALPLPLPSLSHLLMSSSPSPPGPHPSPPFPHSPVNISFVSPIVDAAHFPPSLSLSLVSP